MLGGGLLNKHNSPKLQKFKEKDSKRKLIITAIILSVLLLSGVYLYNSFAVFSEEKNFNVINGTVSDPGDIYFAYYVDNNITREMPKKGSGYTLDMEKSNCTNGVVPTWDNGGWKFIGDYSGYNMTDYTRTRCDLYFKKIDITAVEYIKDLAKYDTETLATDEAGGNVRYIGKYPDNYVSIDGDSWRIIGVMEDIDDGVGNKDGRVKLVRNDSIGEYSWDTSDNSVNSGYGANEWSQADLMKLLNPGYESESVGGSLYWNSGSGTCYNGQTNATTTCDFTTTGLKSNLKSLIDDALWNTGSNGTETSWDAITTSKFYELERSNNTGKNCTSDDYCNDPLGRTTAWVGKVGLMYPSDYGYTTSGQNKRNRGECINSSEMRYWHNNSLCARNSWHKRIRQWTLTPTSRLEAYGVYLIRAPGDVVYLKDVFKAAVFPAVYLKSTVKIVSGTGTSGDPYILGE